MNVGLIIIYAIMCIFDAVFVGGCAYLITAHNWSAWWMLLAVLLAAGNNPKYLLAAWNSIQGGV